MPRFVQFNEELLCLTSSTRAMSTSSPRSLLSQPCAGFQPQKAVVKPRWVLKRLQNLSQPFFSQNLNLEIPKRWFSLLEVEDPSIYPLPDVYHVLVVLGCLMGNVQLFATFLPPVALQKPLIQTPRLRKTQEPLKSPKGQVNFVP